MGTLSWAFVLSALSVLAVLYVFSRRDESQVRRDWNGLLSARSEEIYGSTKGRLESEMALATLTYEHVFAVRDRGSAEDARRLLEVAYQVIEKFCPSMLKLLAAMASFSRMVSAIAPIAPLTSQAFQTGQIGSLAYLNQFLRHFLVTSGERFRLHLYILGRGFGLAARFLLEATRRIARDEPGADRHWKTIEAVVADLQTLTNRSMDSLHALLQGLDRQRAEEATSNVAEQRSDDERQEIAIAVALTLIVLLLALQLLR